MPRGPLDNSTVGRRVRDRGSLLPDTVRAMRFTPRSLSVLVIVAAITAALAPVTASGSVSGTPTTPRAVGAQDSETTVTVMSRNLYLGADVGVALDLIPDLSAAAQFMWDQVAATDFDKRSAFLADEAHRFKPDVIGLQEATQWTCKKGFFGGSIDVFDFTEQFLAATREAGTAYVVADVDGNPAANPGYSIPPLPGLSVNDPQTFQPIFGSDSANCGFTIGDALLVREDLAGSLVQTGTIEYEAREVIVPTVLSIDRGYAWADLEIAGTTVRFVTTHLESLWSADEVPINAEQAQQLVADLADTELPLVVMGDFNSDRRDPRPDSDPNPGSQPEASQTCPAQPDGVTLEESRAECNAYWVMRQAGYASAGPADGDPANYTWGSSALLAGPDPQRLDEALRQGNKFGFTDRLDYVFLRGGATPGGAEVIGDIWPNGPDVWSCTSPEQIANTAAASLRIENDGGPGAPRGEGVCLPTDHAGLVAYVDVEGPQGRVLAEPPPEHNPFRLSFWHILLGLFAAIFLLSWWLIRRRRKRKAKAKAAETVGMAHED